MRRFLLAGAVIALSGCGGTMAAKDATPLSAEAPLKDKDGRQVGVATLIQTPQGVRVSVTGQRLPPGPKGLHVHEVGRCEPPAFTSAGGHFNPAKKKHGRENPEGPHAGDLPNLEVGPGGEGRVDVTTSEVTLAPGPNSLFGERGTSIVIHAGPDDYRSDPAGNSGARIACGVITK